MHIQTLSSWICEGKELSGKKETSPSRKRDTALDAVCPANLTTLNTPKGNHTNLRKNALMVLKKKKNISETDKKKVRQELVTYFSSF